MGGQQFVSGGVALDTSGLCGVEGFDPERGLIRVGAGIRWPALVRAVREREVAGGPSWAIRQKQTGADDLSLGGSVSCNAHGRGLTFGPMVEDVESLRVVRPGGEAVECSRGENADVFRVVVGGYGLFGVITVVTLRLVPRRAMRRRVDITDLDEAVSAIRRRVAEGSVYGDFQFAIDPEDGSFLRRGVLASYEPAEGAVADGGEADLPRDRWLDLLRLAHREKGRAFQAYAEHYLSTHGRVYGSDDLQMSTYIPSYAEYLASARVGGEGEAEESLVISEVYVPPESLGNFFESARRILRDGGSEVIYGTVRSIRRDTETAMPWASRDFACVIFNLRTVHTAEGIGRTRRSFERLYDAALDLGGSFYLTYHRWARKDQLLRAYPMLPAVLERKRREDPRGVLRSDWYDHLARTLGV